VALIQRAKRWSPSADGEIPLSFESATEGELRLRSGGTAQVGGSPSFFMIKGGEQSKNVCSFCAFRNDLGSLFLLHFPDGYPWLTLSVILPYEARTFLTRRPFGMIARDRSA